MSWVMMQDRMCKICHSAPLLLAASLLALGAVGCHDDYEDYYTTGVVTIVPPDSVVVEQMQGTVRITCLSNQQNYQSSDFRQNSVTLSGVLRGPYSISAEGTVAVRIGGGARQVRHFRASTAYCEMLAHPAEVHVGLLLLNN